jgi:hypothetical protein
VSLEAKIWPSAWPNLINLLRPIDNRISAFFVSPSVDGQKGIIRFNNNFGVELFKYPAADFFEMTVIRFSDQGKNEYEFACNIPIPDLNLGYADEDVLRLCERVSRLK